MKLFHGWVLALALLSGGSVAIADQIPGMKEVELKLEGVLSPSFGFEEKNNIQLVLHGYLPDACYQLGDAQLEQVDKFRFRVHQYAYKAEDGLCAEGANLPMHMKMAVPFTKEMNLGRMTSGDYSFVYENVSGKDGIRPLNVARNITPIGDTLPYAMVSSVDVVDVVKVSDEVVVTLSGVLNSSCTTLDQEVRQMWEKDVIVLLPTIKVKPGVMCMQVLIPFKKQVSLGRLNPGHFLIHTRSMNGQAVNRVVEVLQ